MSFIFYVKESKKNNSIEILILSNNYLGMNKLNFRALSEAIIANNSIEYLNIEDNKLSKHRENLDSLVLIIKKSKKLKQIKIRFNAYDESSIFKEFDYDLFDVEIIL